MTDADVVRESNKFERWILFQLVLNTLEFAAVLRKNPLFSAEDLKTGSKKYFCSPLELGVYHKSAFGDNRRDRTSLWRSDINI